MVLAWVFVVLRVLHAGVHVTSNQRRAAICGCLPRASIVLAVMWVIFIVRILLS